MIAPVQRVWGPDILLRASKALDTHGVSPRVWSVLSVSDNLVLRGDDVIAKVARPGTNGAKRIVAGFDAALKLFLEGHPVVQPLVDEVVDTEIGLVSFWPFENNIPIAARSLSPSLAFSVGQALGKISQVPAEGLALHPFAALPKRLEAGKDQVDVKDAETISVLAQQSYRWALESGAWETSAFSHGDVSLDNILTLDGFFKFIDFDSAGANPLGWDLACLLQRINVESNNSQAADAAIRGWEDSAVLPSEDQLNALMAVKLVKATSFLLLHTKDPSKAKLFSSRVATLKGSIPDHKLPSSILSS